jgi:hypothetical protein
VPTSPRGRVDGAGEARSSLGPGRPGQRFRWCQRAGRGGCERQGLRGRRCGCHREVRESSRCGSHRGAGVIARGGLLPRCGVLAGCGLAGAKSLVRRRPHEVRTPREAERPRRGQGPREAGSPREVGWPREAGRLGRGGEAWRGAGALRGAEYPPQAEAPRARAAAQSAHRRRLAGPAWDAIDRAVSSASTCGNCASSGWPGCGARLPRVAAHLSAEPAGRVACGTAPSWRRAVLGPHWSALAGPSPATAGQAPPRFLTGCRRWSTCPGRSWPGRSGRRRQTDPAGPPDRPFDRREARAPDRMSRPGLD